MLISANNWKNWKNKKNCNDFLKGLVQSFLKFNDPEAIRKEITVLRER